MNARLRVGGAADAAAAGARPDVIAATWPAMVHFSALAKTASTPSGSSRRPSASRRRYVRGLPSTLHPVSTMCAPGSLRRILRNRWRVVASAAAVTVHELSTLTSAGWSSGTTSQPAAASRPARSAISA